MTASTIDLSITEMTPRLDKFALEVIRAEHQLETSPTDSSAHAGAQDTGNRVFAETRAIAASLAVAPVKLSTSEAVEAGAHAPFAQALAEKAPDRDLIQELNGAILAGGKGRQYALLQCCRPRTVLHTGPIGAYREDPAAADKGEIRRLLGVIAANVADPDAVPTRERAQALAVRASSLASAGRERAMAGKPPKRFGFQRDDDIIVPVGR